MKDGKIDSELLDEYIENLMMWQKRRKRNLRYKYHCLTIALRVICLQGFIFFRFTEKEYGIIFLSMSIVI
jgi:hypothetical protein